MNVNMLDADNLLASPAALAVGPHPLTAMTGASALQASASRLFCAVWLNSKHQRCARPRLAEPPRGPAIRVTILGKNVIETTFR
jgi:hypothetical protein